jgi:gamma-glutamylcyclotransferase (GGCT)/AIG2-like uncharacterized protein YtfP
VIYFAYGSNLDPVQMSARCPGHRMVGVAVLPDHRLCFPRLSLARGCGVAGLEFMVGEVVWGALYRLDGPDVAALDRYEGYRPADEALSRYLRRSITVRDAGGGTITAEAYFAVSDGCGARPSQAYMRHIIEGARHHGLPSAYVAWLEAQVLQEALS